MMDQERTREVSHQLRLTRKDFLKIVGALTVTGLIGYETLQMRSVGPPTTPKVSIPNNFDIRYFPKEFDFGSAVSAYQVEGNTSLERHNDWDAYYAAHPEQKPFQDQEVGPDWWTYPKAEKDLNRLKDLGLRGQRLGFEWARIEPEKGKIDPKAILRYREIIDFIIDLGMVPLITLNHFTLPNWLKGGYANPDFDSRFKYYAECAADKFGDVKQWVTWNEPTILLGSQYLANEWPPKQARPTSVLKVLENLRKANHEAYQVLKQQIPDSQVGSVHTMIWPEPYYPKSLINIASAGLINYIVNRAAIDITTDGGNDTDFFGYNYYTGYLIKPIPQLVGSEMRKSGLGVPKTIPPCFEAVLPGEYRGDTDWPILPDFFLHSLEYLHSLYPNKPIVITENGIADKEDKYRAFYFLTHLAALHEAIKRGVDIRGYYYWSSVDSLEFTAGYSYKFGLIEVDPITGERKIRNSTKLYEEVAKSGQINADDLISKYLPENQKAKAKESLASLTII